MSVVCKPDGSALDRKGIFSSPIRFNGPVRISEADFKSFLAAHRDH